MAHLQYLVFNNENVPMPASYSVNLSDVEAGRSGNRAALLYLQQKPVRSINLISPKQRLSMSQNVMSIRKKLCSRSQFVTLNDERNSE